jgi:hypothetical protein
VTDHPGDHRPAASNTDAKCLKDLLLRNATARTLIVTRVSLESWLKVALKWRHTAESNHEVKEPCESKHEQHNFTLSIHFTCRIKPSLLGPSLQSSPCRRCCVGRYLGVERLTWSGRLHSYVRSVTQAHTCAPVAAPGFLSSCRDTSVQTASCPRHPRHCALS